MDNNCQNKAICLAPWTHAFVDLNGIRRLCSESREELQPNLTTLAEYWNSGYVKNIRKQMLNGEIPAACIDCQKKKDSHKDYFSKKLSSNLLYEIERNTMEDGSTTLKPLSYDYRISNKCNFKCRSCNEIFSSSWELENNLHNISSTYKINGEVKAFQKDILEKEFVEAIKAGAIEEIHWTGGEPLKWDLHWQVMQFLVDSELAKNVFVRYTTNLSNLDWKGRNLFDEYLVHFKGFQIRASLYATGDIGEYLRTGMTWDKWVYNLDYAIANTKKDKNQEVLLEILFTLPGLFDLPQIIKFASQRDLKLEYKIYEDLENLPLMSPLCLPRDILELLIDNHTKLLFPEASVNNLRIIKELIALKKKRTLQESYPDEWLMILKKSKEHLLTLESRNPNQLAFSQIIKTNVMISSWWDDI